MIRLQDKGKNQSDGQSMDEMSRVTAVKKLCNRPLASIEGAQRAEETYCVSEVKELTDVQAEITHAISLMNEIRHRLELAYKMLAPYDA